jgi:hypothetical protein
VVPKPFADAWDALVSSSNSVDALEDIVCGVKIGLLVIIAHGVVQNQ